MVIKINLAWREAMASMGREFTQAEHDSGWPETLRPVQLAVLQYPFAIGEIVKNRLTVARFADIRSACESGGLPNTATTVPKETAPPLLVRQQSKFEYLAGPANKPKPTNDFTTYAVTAPAFAAWLAAQGETPSPHIQAWFDAVGADSEPQAAPEQTHPAPTVEAVTPAPVALVEPATPAPVIQTTKRRTWMDVAGHYIVEIMRDGQYATAKELYRALEDRTGQGSPFDQGTGNNRYSLFIRELATPLALKTIQNNWPKLLKAASHK